MAIRMSMMVRKMRLPWPFLPGVGGGTASQEGRASSEAPKGARARPRSRSAVSESRGELSGDWGPGCTLAHRAAAD